MAYKDKLKALLAPEERRLFAKLSTPQRIQDYLDAMPNNVLNSNEHTMRSPRRVMRDRKAHCMEGAMLAAAALAYHGRPPLLMGRSAYRTTWTRCPTMCSTATSIRCALQGG